MIILISVTAQEIYRALANNKQRQRRTLCFFRELTDIDELDSKFHDDSKECEQLLTNVKQLLQQSVDSEDIYSYKVNNEEPILLEDNLFVLVTMDK